MQNAKSWGRMEPIGQNSQRGAPSPRGLANLPFTTDGTVCASSLGEKGEGGK